MSDLQDALDLWDINQRPTWVEPIVEAARRVANPDIEAAAKAVSIYVHGYEPLSPDQMRLLEKQLTVGIDAALSITEDTEKPRGAGPGLDPMTAYEQDEG